MDWKNKDDVRKYKAAAKRRYLQIHKNDPALQARRQKVNSAYYQKNKTRLNARARSKRTPDQLIAAAEKIL